MITLRGHTFLPAAVGPDSVVLDLGGNTGDFSRQVRERYGCRVCAVEANPNLVPTIQRLEGVEVLHVAAVGAPGEVELHLSDDILASTVLKGQPGVANGTVVRVKGLTLAQIFEHFGLTRADLIKIDIEGAEVGLIMNAPEALLRTVPQITMEFHDFCGLSTPREVEAVCRRLRDLGFDGFRFGIDNTNWLFAQRNLRGVGALRRWYATQFVRRARNVFHLGRSLLGAHNFGLRDESTAVVA
jgi:FkbM family methyltransferase